MEERRSGAWVDVSNINRTSKGGCARPGQSEGASELEGRPGQGGIAVGTWGRRGARQGGEGRRREGGRASVRWADAASSPELPGYLDLPDHSAPFPCILETINCGCGCAHRQTDPAQSAIIHPLIAPTPAPTDELGREPGWLGPLDFLFPAVIEERSHGGQAGLDNWELSSIHPTTSGSTVLLSPLPSPVIESHRMHRLLVVSPIGASRVCRKKNFKTCKSCVMIQSEESPELEFANSGAWKLDGCGPCDPCVFSAIEACPAGKASAPGMAAQPGLDRALSVELRPSLCPPSWNRIPQPPAQSRPSAVCRDHGLQGGSESCR